MYVFRKCHGVRATFWIVVNRPIMPCDRSDKLYDLESISIVGLAVAFRRRESTLWLRRNLRRSVLYKSRQCDSLRDDQAVENPGDEAAYEEMAVGASAGTK
jgi:hypothetical protein